MLSPLWFSKKGKKDEEQQEKEQNEKLTLLKLRSLKAGTQPCGSGDAWLVVGVSELSEGAQGAATQTSKKSADISKVRNEAGSESSSKISKYNQLLLLD